MSADMTITDVFDAVVHLHNAVEVFSTRVDGRFDRVELRLGGVEHRLEGVERRLMGVERRLTNVEDGFHSFRAETRERFDRLDTRLAVVEGR